MAQPIAFPVLYNTDFRQKELLNPKIHNMSFNSTTSQPAGSGVSGQIVFSAGSMWFHDGSLWKELGIAAGSTVSSVTGGLRITNVGSATAVELAHDTGGASSSNNSNGVVIQSITMSTDGTGHVEGISTVNLDSRYRQNAIRNISVSDSATAIGTSTTTITTTGEQNLTFESRIPVAGYPPGILVRTDSTGRKVLLAHANTTSLTPGAQTSSGQFIQSVSVDGYGHITGVTFGTVSTVDTHLGNTDLVQSVSARNYDVFDNGTLTFRGRNDEGAVMPMLRIDDNNGQVVIGNGTVSGPPHLYQVDLVVNGNLFVRGDVTQSNTVEVNIGDNIVRLNAGVTGTPTLNAGIEIERGTSTNAQFLWDETNDYWTSVAASFSPGVVPTATSPDSFVVLKADNVLRKTSFTAVATQIINDYGLISKWNLITPTTGLGNPFEITEDSGVQYSTDGVITLSHGTPASGYGVNLLFGVEKATTTQYGVVIMGTNTQAFTGYVDNDTPASDATAINPATLRHVLSNIHKVFSITGNGTNQYFTLPHGFNTRNVSIQVFENRANGDYVTVHTATVRPTENAVGVLFGEAPVTGENYTVLVSNYRFGVNGASTGSATYPF